LVPFFFEGLDSFLKQRLRELFRVDRLQVVRLRATFHR